MEIEFDDILRSFLAESEDSLREMEEALIVLENRPDDEETLRTIFRVAHTLKGNAAMVGYTGLSEFAHKVEDVLDQLLKRKITNTTVLTTLFLQCADEIRRILAAATTGKIELETEQRELMARLTECLRPGTPVSEPPSAPPEEEDHRKGPGRRQEDQQTHNGQARTLRVGLEKLDRLVNLTGEIAIARSRLWEVLADTAQRHTPEATMEVFRQSDQLYLELQELVLKVRMVPVGPTFRQYIRTVRDLATARGKSAQLVLVGEDVEVDTSVIEHIRDPLTHMVRNAVDHGIELPDQRRALGKDPCGQIVLRAFHDTGNIVVQLADDGGGLNRQQIAERAVALGLVTESEKMSDAELCELIFEPGFSTAETVTEVSGRGIGMDVVRRNVEALHGSISVESSQGRGTTISIRLPLTLAIISGLLVGVGRERYILPMDAVVECLAMPDEERRLAQARGLINLRGKALPYIRLRSFLGSPPSDPPREQIVVVRHATGTAGVAVDRLIGERQAVIKPLGKFFEGVRGISGSTILSSGRVGLILDVPALMREVLEQELVPTA